jgi:SAM-dependent methyltransferase
MGRYRTRKQLAFLSAQLTGEQLTILDIGGGSGRFAIPLADRGHRVTVVDISRDALELLRSRRPHGIATRFGDFLDHSFEGRFDAVVAMESVQLFTSVTLEQLFARVHAVLRPGGRFVFTELNGQSWRYALHSLRRRGNRPSYNVSTSRGYRTALENAGFQLIAVEGFVWMPFSACSDSRLVPAFESLERALRLNRWTMQSPWLLYAAQRLD